MFCFTFRNQLFHFITAFLTCQALFYFYFFRYRLSRQLLYLITLFFLCQQFFYFIFHFLLTLIETFKKNIATAVCSDIYNIILFKNCQYIFYFISKSFTLSSLPLSYLIHNSFAIPGTGSDFMLICTILLRIPVPQENF